MTRLTQPLATLALVTALALTTSFTATAARADDGARNIITQQLESFLAGDFDQAYSYASDDIKRIFPTKERFMSMVQNGYLPVLRPGNYGFGREEALADGRVVQEVLIRAPDGSDWTAVYFMEKQPDGTWKVDGVNLKKGAAGMT